MVKKVPILPIFVSRCWGGIGGIGGIGVNMGNKGKSIEELFPDLQPIKVTWIPEWTKHPATKHQRAYLDCDVRRKLRLSTYEILDRCSKEVGRRVKDFMYLTKGEADKCIKMFRGEINKIGTRD